MALMYPCWVCNCMRYSKNLLSIRSVVTKIPLRDGCDQQLPSDTPNVSISGSHTELY